MKKQNVVSTTYEMIFATNLDRLPSGADYESVVQKVGGAGVVDKFGRTYLFYTRNVDFANFLIESGVDPDAQDCEEKTALMQIFSGEFKNPPVELCRLLFRRTRNFSLKDNEGKTLYMHAVESGAQEFMESIENHGYQVGAARLLDGVRFPVSKELLALKDIKMDSLSWAIQKLRENTELDHLSLRLSVSTLSKKEREFFLKAAELVGRKDVVEEIQNAITFIQKRENKVL